MFKNTTRRGLALGAAISLLVSGLATVPAQAAAGITLVPSAGTTYNTLVTETFTLQASLATAQLPAVQQLKYEIKKPAGTTISFGVSSVSGTTATASNLNAASTSVVVPAANPSETTQNFVSVAVSNSSSVSPSIEVTVTAFIDSNNNGVLDDGEHVMERKVNFVKFADVATNVAVTQGIEGDTTISGTASLGNINRSQVQGLVSVSITVAGAAANTASGVAADGKFELGQTLVASETVSATVTVRDQLVGAASALMTVTPATVKAVTASAVAGDNAKGTDVRLNSSFVVAGNVKNGTTDTASAVAGVAVVGSVTTSATLSSTISVTVNGTTYTTSAGLAAASFALNSNASGDAHLNVTLAGLTAEDKLTFKFTSQNVTSSVELTAKAAEYTVKADPAFLTVAPSSGFSAVFKVADQFDAAAPAGHRLVVDFDGTTKYPVLNAGVASVAFTATSSATAASPFNATATQLEKQNTTTSNWEADSTAVTTSAVLAVKVTTEASKFDVAPTHSPTASISRVVTASPGLNNLVTLSGTVNHAGDAVTITGAGVKFSSDGETVSVGSITVNADGDGQFTVSAYVHTAGTANLTYAVGAATATSSFKVDAAAANEGKNISVVVVSGDSAAAGSTVRAKVTVTDEYGNPVAVTNNTTAPTFGVTVAGPGFVGTLPDRTGTNGESAEFSILLGSGDTTGTVIITATYDADGATDTIAPITAVKNVTIGSVPASDQKITVGSFKGFVAIYTLNYTGQKLSAKVAGRWLVQENMSRFQRVVRLTGAAIPIKVDLYIDGTFVRTENIVTK